jgi:hypothetical protein
MPPTLPADDVGSSRALSSGDTTVILSPSSQPASPTSPPASPTSPPASPQSVRTSLSWIFRTSDEDSEKETFDTDGFLSPSIVDRDTSSGESEIHREVPTSSIIVLRQVTENLDMMTRRIVRRILFNRHIARADLEAKDNDGSTSLQLSAEIGQLECLKYLIDKAAYLEVKDKEGHTPLHATAYEMWNLECLESLTFMNDQKAEVNARDNQNNTPLHILGKGTSWLSELKPHFCLRATEELIKAGADLTAVNNEGETPMDNELVKILREQKPELFQVNHV